MICLVLYLNEKINNSHFGFQWDLKKGIFSFSLASSRRSWNGLNTVCLFHRTTQRRHPRSRHQRRRTRPSSGQCERRAPRGSSRGSTSPRAGRPRRTSRTTRCTKSSLRLRPSLTARFVLLFPSVIEN